MAKKLQHRATWQIVGSVLETFDEHAPERLTTTLSDVLPSLRDREEFRINIKRLVLSAPCWELLLSTSRGGLQWCRLLSLE